ncbi:MAG: methylhydantoinase [Rhodospirillaceae bacterium]|nr:methylhydantoinase [Rhodospirillaceae bacterium]
MIRVAFDIGGTFTDFVLQDEEHGRVHSLKIPSTPANPGNAVLVGLARLLDEAKLDTKSLDTLLHATTVATNAILERKGSPTGLITTDGFRDVLLIGRQKRYETYDLYINKPTPLIKRRYIAEVIERIDHEGSIIIDLETHSLDRAIDKMLETNRETIAVSLLHSYANPDHERLIRQRIQEKAPHLSVSISSEISPKFREYERTNTTVANAYVKPIVDKYIGSLEKALEEREFQNDLFVMQSSGGLVSTTIAKEYPIRIIESGPAAGVLMGGIVGKDIDADQVITFDMGGTTAKLGAVDDGIPAIMPTFEVGHVEYKKGSGLPITIPSVELLEIGAGGGSIAKVEFGMIAIGPESAGADPGPICYGFGGTRPTITDANVILGYISDDWFNGGTMLLNKEAAKVGILEHIANPLNLTLEEAAWGIHTIATSNMENALRIVSVEQGRDPRRYSMVAFGGAGPLHAVRLARGIGIPKVIIPAGAGVGSAVGLLEAEPRIDTSLTQVLKLDSNSTNPIKEIYDKLEMRAKSDIKRLGVKGNPIWSRHAYMRYVGQGFEISVNLPSGKITKKYTDAIVESFNSAYLKKHKFLDENAMIEGIDWSLVAIIPQASDKTNLSSYVIPAKLRQTRTRPVWFPETNGFIETNIIDRRSISSTDTLSGPAIIEDIDCTTVVLPGDVVRKHEMGHLVIEVQQKGF